MNDQYDLQLLLIDAEKDVMKYKHQMDVHKKGTSDYKEAVRHLEHIEYMLEYVNVKYREYVRAHINPDYDLSGFV